MASLTVIFQLSPPPELAIRHFYSAFIRSPWDMDRHRSQSHDNKRNKRSYFHPNWLQLNVTSNKSRPTKCMNLHISAATAPRVLWIRVYSDFLVFPCATISRSRPLFLLGRVHYLNNITHMCIPHSRVLLRFSDFCFVCLHLTIARWIISRDPMLWWIENSVARDESRMHLNVLTPIYVSLSPTFY